MSRSVFNQDPPPDLNKLSTLLRDFFGMVDDYCSEFKLKIKKGGPVIYCEDR